MPHVLHPLSLPRLALYQYVDVRPTDRVLDLGSGAGFAAQRWARTADSVLGVDISESGVALARRATPIYLRNRLLFECADASDPPYMARYAHAFDLITSSDVFEHIPDTEALVTAIGMMLRPSGRVVITFPNEAEGHGITSFSDPSVLRDLFARHGMVVTLHVLSLRPWARRIHEALWARPLRLFRRRRRRYATQSDQPQVLHETWYMAVAARPRHVYLLVNIYARVVESLMKWDGPVYEAIALQSVPPGRNQRILIRTVPLP